MAALQPLFDTAGAGLSLLDTILHTRVSAEGVVSRTTTRLFYICKYAAGTSPQELCELQARLLSDADPEATGLLVVLPTTFWGVLESSPEAVALLLRWAQAEVGAGPGARLLACRIVAQIEDCPVRAFGPWSYRSMALPAEVGAIDLEAESPTAVCLRLYHAALQVGAAVLESGPVVSVHGGWDDEERERVGGESRVRNIRPLAAIAGP